MNTSKILRAFVVSALFALGFAACESDFEMSKDGFSGGSGVGGSTARFTIAGDYLYVTDYRSIITYDITDPESPKESGMYSHWNEIQTLFAADGYLYAGGPSGMDIYSLDNPSDPLWISTYWHIYSCDPVVVHGNTAYVTLHTEDSPCGRNADELHIIDITDRENPEVIEIYPMTSPRGLAVHSDTLFLCDNGLKVYDVSDPYEIKLLQHFRDVDAQDVIFHNNRLILIGGDGLYQYALENDKLVLIGRIAAISGSSET